jgi:hypothetical protein
MRWIFLCARTGRISQSARLDGVPNFSNNTLRVRMFAVAPGSVTFVHLRPLTGRFPYPHYIKEQVTKNKASINTEKPQFFSLLVWALMN